MKRIAVTASLLLVAGCMTTADVPARAPQPSIAPTDAAALADRTADELAHLARFDPDRLEDVGAELSALAGVLFPDEVAPVAFVEPVRPAPPPEALLAGPSLRHGVHLASYRLEQNAVSGWQELTEEHQQLAALEARLERRHIGDQGVFLRLKAGPFDSRADAEAMCASLRNDELYCMPVDFSGQSLPE